jgi:UDP-glucose 4-epimerase
VHDAVPAMVALMGTAQACGRAINIGGCEEVSIEGLARRIRELTGSTSDIRLVPYSDAYGTGFEDMQRRMPDLSLATDLIGYRPRFGLDDIIKSVIGDPSVRTGISTE